MRVWIGGVRMGPGAAAVSIKAYSIWELVGHAHNGTFVIPPFQRDVVWDQDRMISLWDSMYRFYPIGAILYWKTPRLLDQTRAVGGAPFSDARGAQSASAYRYILDGQQRLTAMYAALVGGPKRIAGKEQVNYTLYFDATAGETDRADAATDDDVLDLEADVFTGADDKPAKSPFFHFHDQALKRREALVSAGVPQHIASLLITPVADPGAASPARLDALRAQPGGWPRAVARLQRLAHLIDHYEVPVTRISGHDVADVCGVYMRINRFGRKLDPADVVMAAVFDAGGAQPGFNLRVKFNEIRDELAALNPRWRRIESLQLFQMIAMCVRERYQRASDIRYRDFSVDTERLLRLTSSALRPLWPDIHTAIVRTLRFFIAEGFYEPERLPAVYLPMPLCAYLFQRPEPDARQWGLIRQWFWRTAFTDDAMSAPAHITRARDEFFSLLEGSPIISPLTINPDHLFDSQGRTSVFSKAFLGFLSNRGPRDFKTGDFVTYDPAHPEADVVNNPTIHHIAPKKLLYNLRRDAHGRRLGSQNSYHENALLNLCLLPGATNSAFGEQSPPDYLRPYRGGPDFAAVLDSHLIPNELGATSPFTLDAYPRFLHARLALFKDALAAKLPDVTIHWTATRSRA